MQRKVAGMQITCSWHVEVVTKNVDGVQRAGQSSWRRPSCFFGSCLAVEHLCHWPQRGGPDAYLYDDSKNCLNFFGGILEHPDG